MAVTAKPAGGGDDRVAVRHPDRLLARQAGEEHAVADHGQRRAAVLPPAGLLDPTAERLGHRLEAVTDAERRYAGLEQTGRDLRRAVGVDR